MLHPKQQQRPARLAQDILHWDGGVLKIDLSSVGALDAHLLLRRSIGDSSKAALNNEGRDLLCLGSSCWVNNWRLGKDGEDLSNSSIGDPDLASIKNPVSSSLIQNCPGLDAACIRATAGFSQSKGCKFFPSGKLGQVLLFLLGSSSQENALESNGLVGGEEDTQTQVVRTDHLSQPAVLGV